MKTILWLLFLLPVVAQASVDQPELSESPTPTATAIPTVVLDPAEILTMMSDQAAQLPIVWLDWLSLLGSLSSVVCVCAIAELIRSKMR